MANMSYCRFENTYRDLQDCVNNWEDDKKLSDSEKQAKQDIVSLAREIIQLHGDED